jgi:ABC-type uncharacterized transport system YnjBCD permease subunit
MELIQIITVLLILSLTTEKIANVVKLRMYRSNPEDVEGKKLTGAAVDTAREKRAQNISLLTGLAVALIAKADLFDMFTGKDFTFFWENSALTLSNITGSLLTGGFLSLGSQFFHDLLAILFQIKNTKSKLANLSQVESMEDVENIKKDKKDIKDGNS